MDNKTAEISMGRSESFISPTQSKSVTNAYVLQSQPKIIPTDGKLDSKSIDRIEMIAQMAESVRNMKPAQGQNSSIVHKGK